MRRKPTIDELEELLEKEEDVPIEILPNGEIRALGKGSAELQDKKPITMREDLGGEYTTLIKENIVNGLA
ncbi:MAG: hypothetical protein F4Z13_03025 [Candidatus Dadabacteria bacterium]|nr:hypothetical protein [Candidatus Dadabacteria bacterium]